MTLHEVKICSDCLDELEKKSSVGVEVLVEPTLDFRSQVVQYVKNSSRIWYSVTIPITNNFKIGSKLLRNFSPIDQIEKFNRELRNAFSSGCYDYLFQPEFNKKGMLHYHGIVSHKIVKDYSSLVMEGLKFIIKDYTDLRYKTVEICRNPTGYTTYVLKEYDDLFQCQLIRNFPKNTET